MAPSRTALILAENHIKTPVKSIPDLPMPTDAVRHLRFVARQVYPWVRNHPENLKCYFLWCFHAPSL